MDLAWQQGPLGTKPVGQFPVAQPLPERLPFAEPLPASVWPAVRRSFSRLEHHPAVTLARGELARQTR